MSKSDIKSTTIIAEIQKRPILFDYNHVEHGDRTLKNKNWEEVCLGVVPNWLSLSLAERQASAKEIQKRWRSIRDSYTKAFRAGKCTDLPLDVSKPDRRRSPHYAQMAFLYQALKNRKTPIIAKGKLTERSLSKSPSPKKPKNCVDHKSSVTPTKPIKTKRQSSISPTNGVNYAKKYSTAENLSITTPKVDKSTTEDITIVANTDQRTIEKNQPNTETLRPRKRRKSINLAEYKKIVETERSLELNKDSMDLTPKPVTEHRTIGDTPIAIKNDNDNELFNNFEAEMKKFKEYKKRYEQERHEKTIQKNNISAHTNINHRNSRLESWKLPLNTYYPSHDSHQVSRQLNKPGKSPSLKSRNNLPEFRNQTLELPKPLPQNAFAPNNISRQLNSESIATDVKTEQNALKYSPLPPPYQQFNSFFWNTPMTPMSVYGNAPPMQFHPIDLRNLPKEPKLEKNHVGVQCDTSNIHHEMAEFKADSKKSLQDDDKKKSEVKVDDDTMFVNSLLPLFNKMDDDTKLTCRIEVLKLMQCALNGQISSGYVNSLDIFNRGCLTKNNGSDVSVESEESNELTKTRSGRSRDIRKRKSESPAPVRVIEEGPKIKRKRGRPRKRRPEDSDNERLAKESVEKREREMEARLAEEKVIYKAKVLTDLKPETFLKMYNLTYSKNS